MEFTRKTTLYRKDIISTNNTISLSADLLSPYEFNLFLSLSKRSIKNPTRWNLRNEEYVNDFFSIHEFAEESIQFIKVKLEEIRGKDFIDTKLEEE